MIIFANKCKSARLIEHVIQRYFTPLNTGNETNTEYMINWWKWGELLLPRTESSRDDDDKDDAGDSRWHTGTVTSVHINNYMHTSLADWAPTAVDFLCPQQEMSYDTIDIYIYMVSIVVTHTLWPLFVLLLLLLRNWQLANDSTVHALADADALTDAADADWCSAVRGYRGALMAAQTTQLAHKLTLWRPPLFL